jgi:hypothetical protein
LLTRKEEKKRGEETRRRKEEKKRGEEKKMRTWRC